MSKTKIMRRYADEIVMIMKRGWIPSTGAYDAVKSNPLSMDYPYAHVLEY